jgi:hypothetical protein
VEDFGDELRLVFRFRRFERRKVMEEDRETRTDDDVEAHSAKLRNDEGDDVEGHSAKLRNDSAKLRNEEGDDDDVEAHVVRNAVEKGNVKL